MNNYGIESDLNIWAPYVERQDEFSLSQMWAERGSGADLETVEAGWQKYRDLYGDWRTHLFIYFTPDNYGSGGCYNLSCSGFVQVNDSYYIGGTWTPSTRGGTQYSIRMFMYKDGWDGHWWLQVGGVWLGYWPADLFDSNGIANYSDRITFGGEIINRNDGRHTRTDMGSGSFPGQGFGQAAYQKRLHYVDLSRGQNRLTGAFTILTDPQCYGIDVRSSSDDNWREYFYYGGSGYNSGCE